MSTRETLIREIMEQPEPLLHELKHYLDFLISRQKNRPDAERGIPLAAWPPGYFQKTAGAFAGEPLERPRQLPFEKRAEW